MDKVCGNIEGIVRRNHSGLCIRKRQEGKLSVCKVTFGAEPKTTMLKNLYSPITTIFYLDQLLN